MNSSNNLVPFANDGLELVIDTSTGASYAPGYRALARICSIGLEKPIDASRVKKYVSSLFEGVSNSSVLEAEIQTKGGIQGVSLIPENLMAKTIRKFNESLSDRIDEAGMRVLMHKLAGYQVSSTAQKSEAEVIAADSFNTLTSGQLMGIRNALANPSSLSPGELGVLTDGISPAVVAKVGALTNEQYIKLYLALRNARVAQDIQDQKDAGVFTKAGLKVADKTIERFDWLQKKANRTWQQAISSGLNQKALED
jgi:hypothetical protein